MRLLLCLLVILGGCDQGEDPVARRRAEAVRDRLEHERRLQSEASRARLLDARPRCTGIAPACLPAIDLVDTAGVAHRPADLDGKVVVLNFWASWCRPCAVEIPALSLLDGAYRARGVAFFGIAMEQDSDATLDASARSLGMTFPVVPLGVLARQLGSPQQLPETFVYDKHGARRGSYLGVAPDRELHVLLEQLLAEP